MDQSLQQELEQLRAENAKLKSNKPASDKALTMKVSEKGAVSIYGLGRFPVTLYKEQWLKLLDASFVSAIREFIEINEARLKTKG